MINQLVPYEGWTSHPYSLLLWISKIGHPRVEAMIPQEDPSLWFSTLHTQQPQNPGSTPTTVPITSTFGSNFDNLFDTISTLYFQENDKQWTPSNVISHDVAFPVPWVSSLLWCLMKTHVVSDLIIQTPYSHRYSDARDIGIPTSHFISLHNVDSMWSKLGMSEYRRLEKLVERWSTIYQRKGLHMTDVRDIRRLTVGNVGWATVGYIPTTRMPSDRWNQTSEEWWLEMSVHRWSYIYQQQGRHVTDVRDVGSPTDGNVDGAMVDYIPMTRTPCDWC